MRDGADDGAVMGALLAWLLSGVATSCFAASFLPNQDDLVTLFSPFDGQVFHPRETVALAAEINWARLNNTSVGVHARDNLRLAVFVDAEEVQMRRPRLWTVKESLRSLREGNHTIEVVLHDSHSGRASELGRAVSTFSVRSDAVLSIIAPINGQRLLLADRIDITLTRYCHSIRPEALFDASWWAVAKDQQCRRT